ncbi:HDOD domain-containing protein [Viridibacterium curvum]|uniref:HDOD domain-containing protein n=1 Tax=Viridibacterium curvum TaxID=1101404 RepID=A0ABP9QDY0_9RHOO
MRPTTVEDVLNALRDLPSVPALVSELLADLDPDEVDLSKLAARLGRDPALVSKVLRVANSPFYGLAGRVQSLQEAATVIGLRSLRSVILAASMSQALRGSGAVAAATDGFWREALASAVCCRALAGGRGAAAEHAFVAGLLHGLGRLALCVGMPDQQAAISAYCDARRCDWASAAAELELPHYAAIGEALAVRWHFPPSLVRAIAQHAAPPADADLLVRIVHVADVIARCNAVASGELEQVGFIDEPSLRLMLSAPDRMCEAWRSLRSAMTMESYL